MIDASIFDILIDHEGLKLKPYRDTAGKLTIGVGRNLDDVGITKDEAIYLLKTDVDMVSVTATRTFPWFDGLSVPRKNVIMSMIFNMGLNGFLEFKNMIALIESGDFQGASQEMLNSRWANQVGQRAVDLSQMLSQG